MAGARGGKLLLLQSSVLMFLASPSAVGDTLKANTNLDSGILARPVTECGNGLAEPTEACDPGNRMQGIPPDFRGESCESLGFSGGELTCTTPTFENRGCRVDTSGCKCRTGPPSPVPKTGQQVCWRYDEQEQMAVPTSCAGTGQDPELQPGVSVDPRFTDNLDGTVTDNLTGLIWLKSWDCFNHSTWDAALDFARNLANGECGLSDASVPGDWRLPNVKEMLSLMEYGVDETSNNALPHDNPFDYWVDGEEFWTSNSVVEDYHLSGMSVDTYRGIPGERAPGFFRAWPVRGGI